MAGVPDLILVTGREETLASRRAVETEMSQLSSRRGFCPSDFAGQAEHDRYGMIAERHKGLEMLTAWARNVDVAVDERIRWDGVCHSSNLGCLK